MELWWENGHTFSEIEVRDVSWSSRAGDLPPTASLRQDLGAKGATGRRGIGKDGADLHIFIFATFQITGNALHMDFLHDLRQPQDFFFFFEA